MTGGLKFELLQDWLKNDAITTHADVSKAQNSEFTSIKWCDLGINRTIFSQSENLKMNITDGFKMLMRLLRNFD